MLKKISCRLFTKTILFISLFSIQQVSAQTNTIQLTLKECIEKGIAYNLQVRQAAYQFEIDKADLAQAKAAKLPSLNGNIIHGINQGRSIDPFTNSYVNSEITQAGYNINTNLTLWNGGFIKNNIRQNEFNTKASELTWQQQKDNVTINIILAYLQILSNLEQLKAAENQVLVTKTQTDRLQILHNSGAIAPATYYDMKGQLSNDELIVLTLKNNLESAKINLSQLINMPYNSQTTYATISSPISPVLYESEATSIYQSSVQNLALVKAAEFRNESAKKSLYSAKALKLPVLSLNGGIGTNYSSIASRQLYIGTSDVSTNQYVTINNNKINVMAPRDRYVSEKIDYGDQWKNNFNSSISINLQIPIMNRLLVKTRIKQAEITQKRADFEVLTVKTQLQQTIDQAYLNMKTALERYETLNRQVTDFTVSFKATEVRFNAGVNTVVEYMLAKNNVDRANANFIAAKYDYLIRTKILDFYQGKPLW
ncbi:MAG: TolC family protein [Chitinophagaceae bacterium]|nr:TolC family protein [Chitinophagaceae bacterium]